MNSVHFLARDASSVQVFQAGPQETKSYVRVPSAEVTCWSPNGEQLAIFDPARGVCLLSHPLWTPNLYPDIPEEALQEEPLNKMEIPNSNLRIIKCMSFSPLGSYVVCWADPKGTDFNTTNLFVWNVYTGELVTERCMRKLYMNHWPAYKWTANEDICCTIAEQSIQLLPGSEKFENEKSERSISVDEGKAESQDGARETKRDEKKEEKKDERKETEKKSVASPSLNGFAGRDEEEGVVTVYVGGMDVEIKKITAGLEIDSVEFSPVDAQAQSLLAVASFQEVKGKKKDMSLGSVRSNLAKKKQELVVDIHNVDKEDNIAASVTIGDVDSAELPAHRKTYCANGIYHTKASRVSGAATH
eukprot:Platyproteum_vivax@DN3930_c0_g1_i2.p1